MTSERPNYPVSRLIARHRDFFWGIAFGSLVAGFVHVMWTRGPLSLAVGYGLVSLTAMLVYVRAGRLAETLARIDALEAALDTSSTPSRKRDDP